MGFVKTPEEVARIEKVASHPRFVGSEMLTIDFLTTPEFVASVLPPGLEPATEPLSLPRWLDAGVRTASAITPAARSI